MNWITLEGHCGNDPELKKTQGGVSLCNFRVADTHRYKKGNEWSETTQWVNVVVFSAPAEWAAKSLQKGSPVVVIGRMEIKDWTGADGTKKTGISVIAEKVMPGMRRGQNQADTARQEARQQPQDAYNEHHDDGPLPDDSDIPF